MNKWKIAFWICLTMLVLISAFSVYSILDQGVTLSYMKESFIDTESDLNNLSIIINETDFSKSEIKKALVKHPLFEYMDFSKDTIPLDRVTLIFKDNFLFKVKEHKDTN